MCSLEASAPPDPLIPVQVPISTWLGIQSQFCSEHEDYKNAHSERAPEFTELGNLFKTRAPCSEASALGWASAHWSSHSTAHLELLPRLPNKAPHTEQLKQQKRAVLLLWTLQVRDQGVVRLVPSEGHEGKSVSGLSPNSWWFAGNLCPIFGYNPWLVKASLQPLPSCSHAILPVCVPVSKFPL